MEGKKRKTKTICTICKQVVIVTTWGANKSELQEIKINYTCSDHATN